MIIFVITIKTIIMNTKTLNAAFKIFHIPSQKYIAVKPGKSTYINRGAAINAAKQLIKDGDYREAELELHTFPVIEPIKESFKNIK